MIKNAHISIKVTKPTIMPLKRFGYNAVMGEYIQMDVKHLSDGSQVRLDVICDQCSAESNMIYAKYVKNVNYNGSYRCMKCHRAAQKEQFTNNNLSLNPDFQAKKKATWLANYGVDNPSKSDDIKSKKIETHLANYGIKNPFLDREKMKVGMLEKYGCEHPMSSPVIKEKRVQSLIIKYGVDNVSKLDEVKAKKIETCLVNYGVYYPVHDATIRANQLKTCLERYGYIYVLQNKDVQEKGQKTTLLRYGVPHVTQNTEIKEKARLTRFEKYGSYCPPQTIIQKQQRRNTCFKRYGVNYPMQNRDIFTQQQRSALKIIQFSADLYYQGTYELHFIKICESNGWLSQLKPVPTIAYTMPSGSSHMYHPDFYIEKLNLIVEIKSTYTYNKELEKNLAKQQQCLNLGYDFIFIIDKEYHELLEKLSRL